MTESILKEKKRSDYKLQEIHFILNDKHGLILRGKKKISEENGNQKKQGK